jgi:hypothetical protein
MDHVHIHSPRILLHSGKWKESNHLRNELVETTANHFQPGRPDLHKHVRHALNPLRQALSVRILPGPQQHHLQCVSEFLHSCKSPKKREPITFSVKFNTRDVICQEKSVTHIQDGRLRQVSSRLSNFHRVTCGPRRISPTETR